MVPEPSRLALLIAGNPMIHPTTLLADALAGQLMQNFDRTFGASAPRHAELLGEAARLVIERIAMSDALYHTAEYTALVTMVALDILRGRRLGQDISPDMWLHVILAALTHDIGYVRGICRGDTALLKPRLRRWQDFGKIAMSYRRKCSPLAVAQRVAHESTLRFRSLNHACSLTQPCTAAEDQARRKSDACRIWGSLMPTRVTLALASNAILVLPLPSAVIIMAAKLWMP